MTSFGCNEVSMAGFNPSFRIQGQVYHLIGSIVPTQGESPKFAQIYFIDNEESEVATRSAIINGLKPASLGVSTNYYTILITMWNCLRWQKRFLKKKTLPLMLGLLLMQQKGPQVNTPGGTTNLLLMRLVY